MRPLRVYGWSMPDISPHSITCIGAQVSGPYEGVGDGNFKKSRSMLSVALSESDASSIEEKTYTYKEALMNDRITEDDDILMNNAEEVDERRLGTHPVDIPWPRGINRHPHRRHRKKML